MKKLILFTCLFWATLYASAQSNLSVAESFVKALSAEKYDEAASYFDPSIKQLNSTVLSSGWKQITTAFGAYKSYYVSPNVEENAHTIVMGVRFQNDTKGFSCNFNSNHQLVGFFLAPAPAEGPVAPTVSKYKVEAIAVPVNGGTIKGSILLPDHSSLATPIALIIAGSGATDRDGNGSGFESNTYKLLAEDFAAKGIATLRYDKRGVGGSNDFKLHEAAMTFDIYVQDAKSIISFLHDSKGFQHVYIIGHSEGALVGMIAAESARTEGYISIAGMGENVAAVLERQVHNDTATAILEQLRRGKQVADVPAEMQVILRPSLQPYLISLMQYEPTKEIQKLKVPILIIQGTTDIQLQVADAERLKAANPKATLCIVKGMNHLLKEAPIERSANIATYNQPQLPIKPQVGEAIATLISEKNKDKEN